MDFIAVCCNNSKKHKYILCTKCSFLLKHVVSKLTTVLDSVNSITAYCRCPVLFNEKEEQKK